MLRDKLPQAKPINIEAAFIEHRRISVTAKFSAHDEGWKGTVAYRHLIRIAQMHMAIADCLGRIWASYEAEKLGDK